MNITDSLDAFRRSLAATTAWCANIPDTGDCTALFRSPQLQPPIDIGEHTDSLDLVRSAVQRVIEQRFSHLVQDRVAEISPDLLGGRLLAFYPQDTICDGLAAIESDGFFDQANVPPWDTWVYFIDDFLISFVPQPFISNVECGLITNVEECIVWLRNVDHPFVRELQNHHLLV
jgi:hypothetical protein